MLLVAAALAAEEPAPARRVLPWFTATAWSYVGSGLQWGTGVGDARPAIGGGVGLLVGPAALFFRDPPPGTKPGQIHIDTGLSAGFLLRVDTPRAAVAEQASRTLGGYFRLGQMDAQNVESRHTVAVGWRNALDDGVVQVDGKPVGQLDVSLVTERRLLPPVAVTAGVDVAVGNSLLPWSVGGTVGVFAGF
jgi:hypothetical protein